MRGLKELLAGSLLLGGCGARAELGAEGEGTTARVADSGYGGDSAPAEPGVSRPKVCIDIGSDTECAPRPGRCLLARPGNCESTGFTCEAGESIFRDACGCGCQVARFDDDAWRPFPVDSSQNCNGHNGLLALFERTPTQIAIGTTNVLVWIGRAGNGMPSVWTVDKRSRTVRALPTATVPPPATRESPAEITVLDSAPPGSPSTRYVVENGTTLVQLSNGSRTPLFELLDNEDESLSALITGGVLYFTASDGALRRGKVSPNVVAPSVMEQRGRYDEDDYSGLPMKVDDDAVYWLAGASSVGTTSDAEPLALYRTCRAL